MTDVNNQSAQDVVDCIVLGGGAAGLMCAAVAGQRGRRVLLLEHANKVGKKILMSGGGRCNFTNYYAEPSNYISNNSHFCKSALKRYTQYDFLTLVAKYDLAFHEKTKGQLFCDNKSVDILNILLDECRLGQVDIRTHCEITSVEQSNSTSAKFIISTSQGEFFCRSLVVATGGLSIPTMGASGLGYKLAQQFGLAITDLQPSLVPYTFSGKFHEFCKELSGVSIAVSVQCGKTQFSDDLLFTHRGLSGPAILQISNYWDPGQPITLDFLPAEHLQELIFAWQRDTSQTNLKNRLANYLPKKFIQLWMSYHGIDEVRLHDLRGAKLNDFLALFKSFTIVPGGTEGYRTAEVTRGGVNTDEVSSKTFEAKKIPGLFFVGEVLDVTGWLGGYNFQWAWSSAYCAAQFV